MAEEVGFLRIGDKVCLQEDDAQGNLGSSGFRDSQLGVRSQTDPDLSRTIVEESVFIVRQQHNYSVTKQMRAFLEREGMNEQEARGTATWLRLLQERKREWDNNLTEFEHNKGRDVRYGHIIQLQHAASQKYASITRQNAELDRDGRRAVMDRDAGELSWFKVMPHLRVHSEGERVHIGDPIRLEHFHTGLELHVDVRPNVLLPDKRHEVSGTHKASPFRVLLYRSFEDDRRKGELLLAGHAMALTHKEADGALGCDLHRAKLGLPAYIWHDAHAISSSNVVWELRKAEPTDGSLIAWLDKVQLRHVGSDQVLMVRLPDGAGAASPEKGRGRKTSVEARGAAGALQGLMQDEVQQGGAGAEKAEVLLTRNIASADTCPPRDQNLSTPHTSLR